MTNKFLLALLVAGTTFSSSIAHAESHTPIVVVQEDDDDDAGAVVLGGLSPDQQALLAVGTAVVGIALFAGSRNSGSGDSGGGESPSTFD